MANLLFPDILGGAKTILLGNIVTNQFLTARDWPFGSAMTMLLVVFVLIGLSIYFKFSNEGEFHRIIMKQSAQSSAIQSRFQKRALTTWAILMYAFLYLPIATLIVFSFNNSRAGVVWKGFTLDWYRKLFHDASIAIALQNSLIIAVVTTLVSTDHRNDGGPGNAQISFPLENPVEWDCVYAGYYS